MGSRLTHGSLFSGIGGFELGAEWAGIKTLWNCEIEEFQRSILKKHFPNAKQYTDIRELKNPEYVDIVSGGFPCQDISNANANAKGIKGERSGLWSEMFRVIRDIRPKYVLAENSPMLLNRGFEQVLCDLSSIGYDVEWQCLSNYQFGSIHKRNRVYVIAYPLCIGTKGRVFKSIGFNEIKQTWREDRKSFSDKVYTTGYFEAGGKSIGEPTLIRKDDRVSRQLDRTHSLGNSVKPQIAQYLFECIKQHNGK